MKGKAHQMTTREFAMRAFVLVAGHPLVRARESERRLRFGDQSFVVQDVRDRFNLSRPHANRIVRTALDVLGFGDYDPLAMNPESGGWPTKRARQAQ